MNSDGAWRAKNIPLPESHLIGLAAGLLLHLMRPLPFGRRPASRAAGGIMLVCGIAIAAWATRVAGTTDLARPDRLVTHGPYKLSRNPMYVSWSLAYIGCALLAGNGWPLILLPRVAAIVHKEVLGEEQRLEVRFGADYRAYAHEVRRYF